MNHMNETQKALNSHFRDTVVPFMNDKRCTNLIALKDSDPQIYEQTWFLLVEAAKNNKYVKYTAELNRAKDQNNHLIKDEEAMEVVKAFINTTKITGPKMGCSASTILWRRACDLYRTTQRRVKRQIPTKDTVLETMDCCHFAMQHSKKNELFDSVLANLAHDSMKDCLYILLCDDKLHPMNKICWMTEPAEIKPKQFEKLIQRCKRDVEQNSEMKDAKQIELAALIRASAILLKTVHKVYGLPNAAQSKELLRQLAKAAPALPNNKQISDKKTETRDKLYKKLRSSFSCAA